MAREVRNFEVAVPAGTAKANPQVTNLSMPPRLVTSLRWRVPPGPAGLMGFALGSAGVRVIPYGASQWIVADDEAEVIALDGMIESGAWQVQAYNTGLLPHALYLTFYLEPIGAGIVRPGPSPVPLTAGGQIINPVGSPLVVPVAPGFDFEPLPVLPPFELPPLPDIPPFVMPPLPEPEPIPVFEPEPIPVFEPLTPPAPEVPMAPVTGGEREERLARVAIAWRAMYPAAAGVWVVNTGLTQGLDGSPIRRENRLAAEVTFLRLAEALGDAQAATIAGTTANDP